ncbi:MAG: hypothetical protein KKF52_05245 [Nanoarchaeota archaeon]|nr:hypothetical protein [Nanoarchaeota archaeon]MBU4351952.1 hypothetical protein [Nanoarchaeota archaeon]
MNLLKTLKSKESLLMLLSEKQYENKLTALLQDLKKTKKKICYVCLSRPYEDVIEDLRNKKFNIDRFYFVDALNTKQSRKYKGCVFVSAPVKLDKLITTIKKIIKTKNCNVIIFDTLSTLLVYEDSFKIVKFTNEIIQEVKKESNVFVVLKEGFYPKGSLEKLNKDLYMIMDKTIYFNKMKKK